MEKKPAMRENKMPHKVKKEKKFSNITVHQRTNISKSVHKLAPQILSTADQSNLPWPYHSFDLKTV